MEMKDGRITPTDALEAEVFSLLLREQELANGRNPAGATKAQQGQPLSGGDGYKIFCAVERRVNNGLLGSREVGVIGDLVITLAEEFVEGIGLDELRAEPPNIADLEDSRRHALLGLASQALTNRYE